MATITVLKTGEQVTGEEAVLRFLRERGIEHERWPLRDGPDPLASYRPELDRLARDKGYIDADVIRLNPATPNLETLLAKFDKDHYHTDDEVRFIQAGEGVFGLEPTPGDRFEVLVTAGDYISIPANIWHYFTLTPRREITAVRLFKARTGWTPYYKPGAAPAGATPAAATAGTAAGAGR